MSGTVVAIVDGRQILHGRATVATAGAPVQLSATSRKLASGVRVKSAAGNTGVIYVGSHTSSGGLVIVSALNGFELEAVGASDFIEVDDLNKVWIDASANTQSVTYIAT